MADSIQEWLETGRLALQVMREALPFLPDGSKKEELQSKIANATDALKRSDAALAKNLGYQLCRCKFPPEIMLWDKEKESDICPICGTRSIRQQQVSRDGGRLLRSRLGDR